MSSTQSRAYHSITFGTNNTWDDWGLIPASRPVFAMPSKKTNLVEIQGADSTLDMSETLTGFPLYNNREGSFEFYVDMDCAVNRGRSWQEIYSDIVNYLHGKSNMTAILDDDPSWYYKGEFTAEWTSHADGTGNTVNIGYKVYPYKLSNTTTRKSYAISESASNISFDEYLDRMPVIPTITASASGMSMSYTDASDGSSSSVNLTSGTHKYGQVVLCSLYRAVILGFTGSGTITIEFQNGRL